VEKSVSFTVASYAALAQRSRIRSGVEDSRLLNLLSGQLSNGLSQVTIWFSENDETYGMVVFPGVDPDNGGVQATISAPKDDFAVWYDIVRNEQPINVVVTYDDAVVGSSPDSRQVTSVAIITAISEPPGEGPEGFLQRVTAQRDANTS
jgi:hypothetical protein